MHKLGLTCFKWNIQRALKCKILCFFKLQSKTIPFYNSDNAKRFGKAEERKKPLIRSTPPPTVSFCRLQSLASRRQLKGMDSWIHRDALIPKGTLSPPRACCLSAPHSILGDSQAVLNPLCLTHPSKLSHPTPTSPTGFGKGGLVLLANSLTCPITSSGTEQDSPHMNPPSVNTHT